MADWITTREAARILDVHLSAIPKMIRRGDLSKRNRRPVLNMSEVIAYREARAATEQERRKARERSLQPKAPAPPDPQHEWLLADAAAAVMGISRVAINARARRGRLPSALANGRRWYRRDHLELVLRAEAAMRQRGT